MAKIFLTGATGYIGGDVLHQLVHQTGTRHSISCLVRDVTKSSQVAAAYPHVRIVRGDLDDTQLIEQEARDADIVLNLAATAHFASCKAIVAGLTNGNRARPGHWIQISGASLFAGQEVAAGRFGCAPTRNRPFDDVQDRDEILATIRSRPERAVDNLVISQDGARVKTALVIGPHIYGPGRGPVNTRSVQAPEIARVTMELRKGFRLGEGRNVWSVVHVRDVSNLVLALVDAAVDGRDGVWNEEGLYCPENGEREFGELCARIAEEAFKQGFTADPAVTKVLDAKTANSLSAHASVILGTNSVVRSSRANSLLGWKPSGPSLEEELPDIVRKECEKGVQKF